MIKCKHEYESIHEYRSGELFFGEECFNIYKCMKCKWIECRLRCDKCKKQCEWFKLENNKTLKEDKSRKQFVQESLIKEVLEDYDNKT